jgi:molybdenum cofactor sulfurtransferase
MRRSRSVSSTAAELIRVPETEIYQDGTLNYTLLPAVTTGLRLLGAYLPALPARIAALSASCVRLLEELRWSRTGTPAVRILSRIPGAPPEPGEAAQGAGGVIACLMFDVRYRANSD